MLNRVRNESFCWIVQLMEASLAKELGLHRDKDQLALQWFDRTLSKEDTTIVSYKVHGTTNEGSIQELKNIRVYQAIRVTS